MLIVCDFDGTITTHDCLNLIVQDFAAEAWAEIEPRLRAGEIDLLQAIEEEFLHVRLTEEQAVRHVLKGTEVRAGFHEFVTWTEDVGHELVIVSAGFKVLIDAVLATAGLSRLRVFSGDACFTPQGTTIQYPPSAQECASRCGMCKADAVREVVAASVAPSPLVHVGDGLSDLCVARTADIVFARAGLARLLQREHIQFYPFEDFFEVRRILEALTPI